eukprot:TRINITY_DN11559_c0_g1_i1.p1 TRINITY_DN11559_c0_g1~~TRINITY_DN11559_c0_g1_i1.p1  ORF type:complete len:205 (+),score=41.51 TRINITY_DN11559_c0_g1_i1:488-1102(+)
MTAIQLGHVEVARRLMKEPLIDPSFKDARALQEAARRGQTSVVSLILSCPRMETFFSSSTSKDLPIRLACHANKPQVLSLLLLDGRSDPTVYNNELVERAAEEQKHEILEILLNHPKVDPGILDRAPLKWALHNNDIKAINLLLNHPKSRATKSLVDSAKRNSSQQIYNLLLENWKIHSFEMEAKTEPGEGLLDDQKDLFATEE